MGRLGVLDIPPLMRAHFTGVKETATYFEKTAQNELPDKGHRGGPCIPGVRKLFVDVDGNLFPCERVSESSEVSHIGHIDQGIDEEKALQLLNIEWLTSDNCRNCWAYNMCSNCFTFADDEGELSRDKQLEECKFNKIQAEGKIKDYLVLRELGYSRQMDV